MSDDYDTDLDSDQDEFERENLIDDIKKMQIALADSDVEEDEEDEENTDFIETSSFKYNRVSFSSNNVENTTLPESQTQATLTELVPIATDQKKQENASSCHGYHSLTDDGNQSESSALLLPERPGTSGCHGNFHEPSNNISTASIPDAEQYNQEISSNYTIDIIPITMATNDSVSQEQAIYNFAEIQQGIAGYIEEVNDREVTAGPTTEVASNVHDDVNVASLGLRELMELTLARNQEYQSQILHELHNIDLALVENEKKQFSLNQAKMDEEDEIQKALPTLIRFSCPYFRDSDGHGPTLNEDARYIRSYIGIGAYSNQSKAWNLKEEKLLAEGVRMQNLKNKLSPLLKSLKEVQNELNVDAVQVTLLNRQIMEVRELPPKALEQGLDGLDWDKLVTEYLPKRTAIECRLHWCHFGHPRVNKKPWTIHEDKMLLRLAKDRDQADINWNDVAQTIQTNRTPIQCYQRFQRSLNKEILRSKWTPEEDEQLTELVMTFGQGNWQRIADYLEGRMGEQCMHRYMKACRPARKGRWYADENEKLLEAVRLVGEGNWEKVSEYVPGRTGTQCRERFVNVVNPTLTKGPWDKEEDTKLLALVERFGEGNWSKIAKEVVSRTDNQCWRRWIYLRREDSLHYRMNTLRKKREMVANFVGRRREKPMLRPEDLDIQDIPIPNIPLRSSRSKYRNRKKRIKTEHTTQHFGDEKEDNKSKSDSSKPCGATPTPIHDHNYANIKDKHVTSSETGHVTTSDESGPQGGIMIKRRVSVSSDSDEEWDECVVIDAKELGTRSSSMRKRCPVNYTVNDDFVSDLSQDDEDFEEDYQQPDGQVKPDEKVRLEEQVKPDVQVKLDEQVRLEEQVKPDVQVKLDEQVRLEEQIKPDEQVKLDEQVRLIEQVKPDEQVKLDEQVRLDKQVKPNELVDERVNLNKQVNIGVQVKQVTRTKRVIKSRHDVRPQNAGTTSTTRNDSPAKPKPTAQSQAQGRVASFSLLLQAFNINVSGVLHKVKPTPSQHALQASIHTGTESLQKSPLTASTPNKENSSSQSSEVLQINGQQSHLTPTNPNKENSSSPSSEKSEVLQITGQQSHLTPVTPNKENSSSHSSEKSEVLQITGQQSLLAIVAPNKDNSSTPSRNLSESPQTRSQQSPTVFVHSNKDNTSSQAPKDTCTQSPEKNPLISGSKNCSETPESSKRLLRSPSKRKSTTPRRRRTPEIKTATPQLSTQILSEKIEGIIEQNDKVLSSIDESKKSDSQNKSQSELANNTNKVKESVKRSLGPMIPTLPPCSTTLKGLKNLLRLKGQLEILARKVSTNTRDNVLRTPLGKNAPTRSPSSVINTPITNTTIGSVNTPLTRSHLSVVNTSSTRSSSSVGNTPITNTTIGSVNTYSARSPSSAANNSSTRSPSTRSPSSAANNSSTRSPARAVNTYSARSPSSAVNTFSTRSPPCAFNTPITNVTTGSVNTPSKRPSSAVITSSTRSPSSTVNVNTPITNTTSSVIATRPIRISKRAKTDIHSKEPTSCSPTPGLAAMPTSDTVDKSLLNGAIPSESTENPPARPESSVLASLPRLDPRFSQDPFVRYFLYRKTPEYKLLGARFNSLFLWPMLMSKVPLVGKIPIRQNNWGFPHMFAVPGTPTPMNFNKPRASSVSTVARSSSTNTSTNSSLVARTPGNMNSSTTTTNSHLTTKGPEDSSSDIDTANSSLCATISGNAKGKTTKRKSEKIIPNSQSNLKRDSRSSSSPSCENVIPKKKRREETQTTANTNEQSIAKVKSEDCETLKVQQPKALPENTSSESNYSKRRIKKKTFSSDFTV